MSSGPFSVSAASAEEISLRSLPKGTFATSLSQSGSRSQEQRNVIVHLKPINEGSEGGANEVQAIRLFAQRARLYAERSGAVRISFPIGFEAASESATRVAESERRLYAAKVTAAENQKAQLRERVKQFEQEAVSLEAQRDAKKRELDLVRRELSILDGLHRKQLTGETRMLSVKRDVAKFEGEVASLSAQVARVKNQVNEANLQVAALRNTAVIEAEKELQNVEAELGRLVQSQGSAQHSAGYLPMNANGGGYENVSISGLRSEPPALMPTPVIPVASAPQTMGTGAAQAEAGQCQPMMIQAHRGRRRARWVCADGKPAVRKYGYWNARRGRYRRYSRRRARGHFNPFRAFQKAAGSLRL